MIHSNTELKSWKNEQIAYFREYLKTFDKGSREYEIIKSGIERLEKNI